MRHSVRHSIGWLAAVLLVSIPLVSCTQKTASTKPDGGSAEGLDAATMMDSGNPATSDAGSRSDAQAEVDAAQHEADAAHADLDAAHAHEDAATPVSDAGMGDAGDPSCAPGSAGNPFVDGWYADPDMKVYDKVYWVYPTYSYPWGDQTFLDAFSSPDLVHWTKHEKVFQKPAANTWIRGAIWAPSPIFRNGTYYLYFGANDYHQGDALPGGIGVATSNQPGGPFLDAIGAPLIGEVKNGANPIDQNVFIDDDGQAYLYYGGGGHCNVVKLNEDMKSIDASSFKEVTPSGYVEGALMFKRGGRYYLMWSEGNWTGPDYRVSYAIADSPLGPFNKLATILSQDDTIGTGSGHNTVVNVPGTDDWYIFYHRHPLGETDGNHRVLSYDRLYFNGDGTIQPVKMSCRDNFCDGNALGWATHTGDWSVSGHTYKVSATPDAKSLLNTNFASLSFEADVSIGNTGGDAGLIFRVSEAGDGLDDYKGYYAGISAGNDRIVLGKVNHGWTELASANLTLDPDVTYHLKVVANGAAISVYFDGSNTPVLTASDSAFASGATGLRAHDVPAVFDNVSVSKSP